LKVREKFSVQEWCHFCGKSVCKECAKDFKRTRSFPLGKGGKGKICKVCDAKIVLTESHFPQKQELLQLERQIA
jgi:hypothetical protein